MQRTGVRAGSSAGRGGGDKAESKERERLLKSRAEDGHSWPRDLFESEVRCDGIPLGMETKGDVERLGYEEYSPWKLC